MILLKTRSGRFLNAAHVISLSIEEAKIEIDGRKRNVFKIVAYLTQPLLPAVIGIYATEEKAKEVLNSVAMRLSQDERIIATESEF
ncbi:MAG: hypothetical protein ABDH18_03955 [Aquificaceae bacterium]